MNENKSKTSNAETDKLITRLSDNLEPAVPLSHPIAIALPWLSLSAIYIGLMIYIHGIRFDFTHKYIDQSYIGELALALAITVTACFSSFWLKTPDIYGRGKLYVAPIFIAATFITLSSVSIIEHGFHLPPLIWHPCHTQAIIFGVIPSALIIFLSTKGKTTHPYMLSLMNALAVGGLGYIALRISCASDDIGHICVYHVLPFAILALVMTIFANKLYKW